MGGNDVNSDNVKNNDPLQLQQMVIFLKAELAKYKYEVKKYQDDYHHSLVEALEQDNNQLMNEKNELSEELFRLNKELIKRTIDYKERIHLLEMECEKYITSIDALQKTKTDLWTTNKQFTEAIQNLKDGLDTNQHNDKQNFSLNSKIAEYKTTIEQLEYKLVDLIQNTNKQLYSKLEKLDMTNQERKHSKKVNQHLLKEIIVKNKTIRKLQLELSDVKEQHKQLLIENSLRQKNVISTSTPTIEAETLLQLDHQIKKVLAQSLDYEEKLDAKLLVLNALEQKLDQLTVEIDDIKIFSVEGRVLKEF
jgi:chromosome segregation ATPase